MEDWRFTNVARLLTTDYKLPESDLSLARQLLEECRPVSGIRLVMVNGKFSSDLSDMDRLPGEVEAITLSEAEKYPKVLKGKLSKIVSAGGSTFAAANTALIEEGLFLRISEDTNLSEPLQLLYISTGPDNTYSAPRALVVTGKNATVSLIEQFIGSGHQNYLSNSVSEIFLEASASMNYYRIQQISPIADHISSLGFSLAEGSSLKAGFFDFGGQLIRNDISVQLNGERSSCKLSGLQILTDSQHCDYHTFVRHASPHCQSNELFKSILGGKARSVFNGLIRVDEGAEGTDSVQTNRNLLLSSEARVNSNPQLEIYTDDVKCSHGSATGQLDEDALFYFRSRGIAQADAYMLMVTGFSNEVLDRLSHKALRDYIESEIIRKLDLIQNKEIANG